MGTIRYGVVSPYRIGPFLIDTRGKKGRLLFEKNASETSTQTLIPVDGGGAEMSSKRLKRMMMMKQKRKQKCFFCYSASVFFATSLGSILNYYTVKHPSTDSHALQWLHELCACCLQRCCWRTRQRHCWRRQAASSKNKSILTTSTQGERCF